MGCLGADHVMFGSRQWDLWVFTIRCLGADHGMFSGMFMCKPWDV